MATGNWGCGTRLKGDPQLKLVIQWLAASLAGAPRLIYYTSGNPSLSKVNKKNQRQISPCNFYHLKFGILVGHCDQSSDGQTLVGGRSGRRDAEVRRADYRGTDGRQEHSLRGDYWYGQTESLARHNAVRSGGRASHHDRGQPVESLMYQ